LAGSSKTGTRQSKPLPGKLSPSQNENQNGFSAFASTEKPEAT